MTMQRRIAGALALALGLGVSLGVLGAAGGPETTRYDMEMGSAHEKIPMVVRLDTRSGQLCAFVFDQVQQSLQARGCYPHVDKGW
jgi:hypothetical protein